MPSLPPFLTYMACEDQEKTSRERASLIGKSRRTGEPLTWPEPKESGKKGWARLKKPLSYRVEVYRYIIPEIVRDFARTDRQLYYTISIYKPTMKTIPHYYFFY